MKLKLLPKFIISLIVVGLIMALATSYFSYTKSKQYLENMYADKVIINSKAIADMLDKEDIKTIIAEGGENTDAYQRTYELFNQLKKDGEITFLSLVIPDEDSVCFYIDAMVEEMGDDPAHQLPYGSDILYVDAANPDDPADYQKYITIWENYAVGKGLDEPLVTDNSYGYNYTGVAVVEDENGNAIAEIQYILDMTSVRAYLNSFLSTMLVIASVVIFFVIFLYVIFVRNAVTKPIEKLAKFTEEITNTQQFANQEIEIKTGDEIESLAGSFNFMLKELGDYIDNLSRITAEKERIGAELDIATNIQASMLPNIFPAFPNRKEFDIYATMAPAKEVGGDFYDFFMVDDRHLAMVCCDVSGKGVPAALFMVIGKTLIKDNTTPNRDLGEVFTAVNNLLCESNSEGLFITGFEGVLDLYTGEFTFVNAGHEHPFIYKKDGKFEEFKTKPGLVLAGLEGMTYRSGSMILEPGDKVFQYTDGITEATAIDNELYGMERLETALNKYNEGNLQDLLHCIRADIDEFVGEAPQFDDITMICLEYKERMKLENEE